MQQASEYTMRERHNAGDAAAQKTSRHMLMANGDCEKASDYAKARDYAKAGRAKTLQ